MKRFVAILMSLLLATISFAETNTASLKAYSVHFAEPEDVAEIIPLMVPSTNGLTVKTTDDKVIIRGTAEHHTVARQVLADMDSPPKNVQINVEFDRSGTLSGSEFGVQPRGPVVIRDGKVHGSFEGRFSQKSGSSDEFVMQMLVAMDGRSASLRVGETVPHLKWLTQYSYRHGYIQQAEIEWRDVGSFLTVMPEIIGNGPLIRVRVTPTLSGRLKDGTEETIEFTELSTELLVRDGSSISIGGFSDDDEFSRRFLVGRAAGRQSSVTGITLTPRILR